MDKDFRIGFDNSNKLPSYVAIYERLRNYEDLEEQGKLLKLPCTVEDTIYHLCILKNKEPLIIKMEVGCVDSCGAIRNHKGMCEIWNVYAQTDYTKGYFKFFDFGKTVFLTREEAENALKEYGYCGGNYEIN